jgi:hypothetical protein
VTATLTPAQQRALSEIYAAGYAVYNDISGSYGCNGRRLRYDMVRRMLAAKALRTVVVRPGQTVRGFTNSSRLSRYIVVPT